MKAVLAPVAAFVLSLAAAGCLVAGAGAGAGGAVYLTSRGAKSVVPASIQSVAAATEEAFAHFGIERTSLEVEGDGVRREVKGRPDDGDPEVTVTMRRTGEATTELSVTARTSLVTWDKDYARGVTEKIVEIATAGRETGGGAGGRATGTAGAFREGD